MNAFEVKNISFLYKDKKVINNFSLTQKIGDVVLWSGPSGGGKTSLAKIICSHLKINSGEIKFFDKESLSPALSKLYVCHENDLFEWQTFSQHIKFLLNNVKIASPLTAVEIQKYSELLEISHLMNMYPSQISMGETRRFQILRSLILKSDFIVFDETFAALDSELKKRLMPKLLEIWKKHKTTVVIISHEADKNFNVTFDQALDFSSLLLNDK
ncbi:MAG: ATP-binding cassette domain-containing protein [Pseudobdellovibrio sp.]